MRELKVELSTVCFTNNSDVNHGFHDHFVPQNPFEKATLKTCTFSWLEIVQLR